MMNFLSVWYEVNHCVRHRLLIRHNLLQHGNAKVLRQNIFIDETNSKMLYYFTYKLNFIQLFWVVNVV